MTVLAVVLAAACGTRVRFVDAGGTPTPSPSSSASASPTATPTAASSPAAPASMDPLKLVRWWTLTFPARGWAVAFGEQLQIVAPCGDMQADWQASPSGLFAAAETGGTEACVKARPDLAWYRTPRAFALVGSELDLFAPDGTVSARLSPAPVPAGQKAPALTAYQRARFVTPAPLPSDAAPTAHSSLQGRWAARGKDAGNGRGYVMFGAGWTWTGSDGCNGDGGSFAVGPAGDFLSTNGPHTGIGCDFTPAPSWVHDARRIGLAQGALVLYDVTGKLLGRLWPAPAARPAPTASAVPR